MTGGSEVGGVAVVSSGAAKMGELGETVALGSGAVSGVVAAGVVDRGAAAFADFEPGACQPGITSSMPGRILAGSEILFAVAISPILT